MGSDMMADFLNFIPIETRGMSILTAITFFFYTVGFGYFYSTMKQEFKRIFNELKTHEDRLNHEQEDMAEVKTNIALLLQSMNRIEEMLEKRIKME